MNDRARLTQIRALRDRLERLPASPERDWMLGEVRSRAVDLESGVRAAPLRPLRQEQEADFSIPEAPPVPPRATPGQAPPQTPRQVRPRQHRAPNPIIRDSHARSGPSVAAAPTAPAARTSPLPEGVRLTLDDDAVVSPEPGHHRPTPPWARGLRG